MRVEFRSITYRESALTVDQLFGRGLSFALSLTESLLSVDVYIYNKIMHGHYGFGEP